MGTKNRDFSPWSTLEKPSIRWWIQHEIPAEKTPETWRKKWKIVPIVIPTFLINYRWYGEKLSSLAS
jgi:hypothetical protein